jgi:hypothetical protein
VGAPQRTGQDGALVAALLAVGGALVFVPSWRGSMTEVCRLAGLGAALVMVTLLACRLVGPRAAAVERRAAALFLAGMPIVYIVRWFEVDGAPPAALAVEIGGLVFFAALAILGLTRSPWFLVVGIAVHGMAWDAWHWLLGSTFMFDWYAIGCLVCDVGLSAYLAVRICGVTSPPNAADIIIVTGRDP